MLGFWSMARMGTFGSTVIIFEEDDDEEEAACWEVAVRLKSSFILLERIDSMVSKFCGINFVQRSGHSAPESFNRNYRISPYVDALIVCWNFPCLLPIPNSMMQYYWLNAVVLGRTLNTQHLDYLKLENKWRGSPLYSTDRRMPRQLLSGPPLFVPSWGPGLDGREMGRWDSSSLARKTSSAWNVRQRIIDTTKYMSCLSDRIFDG